MKPASLVPTLIKLAIAAVVAVVLFSIVLSAMRNPVRGNTNDYSADFLDVSGLHVNGDVRTKGVRIGKVTDVELISLDGQTVARVGFTMQDDYSLTADSRMSVKYQNMTGVRYLDVDFGTDPGNPVASLPVGQTRPSYDITALFNGLAPVLDTMRTEEINEFAQNAITILEGDGTGLAPMLKSTARLARLASDREHVISTLTENLARIADSMGGRSEQVVEFMRSVSIPIAKAMTVLEEFGKTATYGPAFLTPVHRIITSLGIQRGTDIDALVQDTFSSLADAAETLTLLPSTLAAMQVPASERGGSRCSKALAVLPEDVRVLLNGSEVVVCAQ